VIFEIFISYFE